MTGPIAPPLLVVKVDGRPLGPMATHCFAGAWISQTLNAPAAAEIAFADPGPAGLDEFRLGAGLELALDRHLIFSGDITEIEAAFGTMGERSLRVRALDLLHRLGKSQQPRALTDTTVGDLVRDAAAKLGLDAVVDTPGPARRRRLQLGQTDLDFLIMAVQLAGLCLTLQGRKLRLMPLSGWPAGIELAAGRNLASARQVKSLDGLRRSCGAAGWDPSTSSQFKASADAPDNAAPFPELGRRHLFNMIAESTEEVEACARADVARAAARAARISGSAEGDSRLTPGAQITVRDAGAPIDGRYVVTSTVHRIEPDAGYLVDFATEMPSPAIARGASVTLGTIIDLDDPDDRSRVRVTMAAAGDLESDWLPLIVAGAGADKGMIAFPALGDEVLLLFPDGDPARGLVLGGVYGTSKPPGFGEDTKAAPSAVGIRTGGGQLLFLAGDKALARLETSAGDLLEMTPDATRLQSHSNLLIAAPGQTITLRARAIEFEQG